MFEIISSIVDSFPSELILILVIVLCLFFLLFGYGIRKIYKKQGQQQVEVQHLIAHLSSSSSLHEKQQALLMNNQQHFSLQLEQQFAEFNMRLSRQINEQGEKQSHLLAQFNEKLLSNLHQHQNMFNQNQLKSVDQLVEHLQKSSFSAREEQAKSLQLSSEAMADKIKELTKSTDERLKEISGQVEKRLTEGFDKTTKTFNDILKRLALIDDAQKKITELSTNVVSLQEVLSDKRSRGAFGEVQLNSLIRNVLPEQHFSLQHTLSNGKIADCILFLPSPTGNVVIDAKFPLENYKKMMDNQSGEHDRKSAERQFKLDIKKHINDISTKYILEEETSDGAIMFIPAEAIFAEIHAHQSDLVDFANKQRVWLASPTTLMAILTTSRSVLKDEATRKQVHVIQKHLSLLSGDFTRFKGRFANLAKHIDQAATDVKQIHTSADKISSRFEKIENVDIKDEETVSIENTKV